MSFTNGFSGNCVAGSLTLSVENWSADAECEALDTTSTGDGGNQTNIAGTKKTDITFHTYYDSTIAYMGVLAPGSLVSFTGNIGATSKTLSGNFRITKANFGNPVKGVCDLTVNATSNGAVTLPN